MVISSIAYSALAKASILHVALESEQGTKSGNVIEVGDVRASGAKGITFSASSPIALCPASGVGGAEGCKQQCTFGMIGAYPDCSHPTYTTMQGLKHHATLNGNVGTWPHKDKVYDGVRFTERVVLTAPENVTFKNCRFDKQVWIFGAYKNVTFENCVAIGSHDYNVGRFMQVETGRNYFGLSIDYNRVGTGLVIKKLLVEDYGKTGIYFDGGENTLIDDFVIRKLWASGQGAGDVDPCKDSVGTETNEIRFPDCAPYDQEFDPHVDGINFLSGSATIKRGLIEQVSYTALQFLGTKSRSKPTVVTVEDVTMRKLGFRHTASLCSAWTGPLKYSKICGTSGGGTGIRAADYSGTLNPDVTLKRINQSDLGFGLLVTSPRLKWRLQDSNVTYIRTAQFSTEGDGPAALLFKNNTRSREMGWWQVDTE